MNINKLTKISWNEVKRKSLIVAYQVSSKSLYVVQVDFLANDNSGVFGRFSPVEDTVNIKLISLSGYFSKTEYKYYKLPTLFEYLYI